jgi:hypothetical protein
MLHSTVYKRRTAVKKESVDLGFGYAQPPRCEVGGRKELR